MPQMAPVNWLILFYFFLYILFNYKFIMLQLYLKY